MERGSSETWAKRIERWRDSGLSAREYCTETGINARSLSWWTWRLGLGTHKRRRAVRPASTTPPAAPISKEVAPPLTFVEVTAAVKPEAMEVVLPSSIRIRVPVAFDSDALARLLDVLERRR